MQAEEEANCSRILAYVCRVGCKSPFEVFCSNGLDEAAGARTRHAFYNYLKESAATKSWIIRIEEEALSVIDDQILSI